jgi:hypothetical protein
VSKKPTEAPQQHDAPEPATPHPHKHPHQDPDPVAPDPATDAASILKPIMDDLKGTTQLPTADEVAPPRGPLHPPQPAPPQPAELDQDPGGGYNPDGTYPQT